MLERRNNPRKKMVLPVKIAAGEGRGLAYTIDINCNGARIGGLRVELGCGQVVSLTRNGRKVNFKVVWVRQLGPGELQAGVEALQPLDNFWGVELTERMQTGKSDVDALMTLLSSGKKI